MDPAAPNDPTGHIPVLPDEVLTLLNPRPGQTILDCTVGRAGHAALIAPRLAPGGHYIGLDVDPENVEFAKLRLASLGLDQVRISIVRSNFAAARSVLNDLGVGKVDLLLADLGFASNQMDNPDRGFSFGQEGPLDMRLDPDLMQSARHLVNRMPEPDLADLIYRYGEERLSRKIARKIVEARQKSPISTTAELARLVREAYGRSAGMSRIDPATRTFMALRIAVNAELEALQRLLEGLPDLLAPQAVAAIISFHSLEDRLVKHAFAEHHRLGQGRKLTSKPVIAGESETMRNPRSRSAKLRALAWIGPQPSERVG